MRYTGVLLLLILVSSPPCHGQAGFLFNQLPADFQLFARDNTNQATIVISGIATSTQPQRVSVQVWREGQHWAKSMVSLPVSRPASFSVGASIRSGRAQYIVRVFSHTGTDSTLLVERTRIVCGDFIQIHGQSNAIAFDPTYSFDDTYARNVAFLPGSDPSSGQVGWFPAKQPYGSVGLIGWRLQELILHHFDVPVCIINGAIGGAGINVLSARNANNPASLNTAYGQLLFRHQWASAIPRLRAIVWKQGETEAGGAFENAAYYSTQFDQLYRNWRQDYGPQPRIYVSQINFMPETNQQAGAIRDFQRRTKTLYANLETIATVGTPGHDGVHYSTAGNLQIAGELFRQIARDVYASTDTLQINSPDIQRAYYNTSRDTLTMVFQDDMRMVWPADSTLTNPNTGTTYQRRMVDFLYINGQNGRVQSGTADRNRVRLKLTSPQSGTALTYLPSFFTDSHTAFYNGVHLKNSRNMRAFSFNNVFIANVLPAITWVSADLLPNNQIRITWNPPAMQPLRYELDRSDDGGLTFNRISQPAGVATQFIDQNLPYQAIAVYYRIRAITAQTESIMSSLLHAFKPDVRLADLSLGLVTSARIMKLNEPFIAQMTVYNNGPSTATTVVLENRLPPHVTFLGGNGLTHLAGVVSATLGSVAVSEMVSLTYTLSIQQPGRYVNAAQIIQSSVPDPDSQTNSGTADGQDDAVMTDFRSTPTNELTVYVSPNPIQHPLPPVQANQPTPVAGQTDLSLQITPNTLTPAINEVVTFTLTVSNRGGAVAALATVVNKLPDGLMLHEASGWTIAGNDVSISLTNLAVGESRHVWFRARATASGIQLNQAQISHTTPIDSDSTPGNGYLNGEDDTASVSLRVR